MKKALIAGGVILLLAFIAFIWLLSGASADNAPKEIITIDIPDSGVR